MKETANIWEYKVGNNGNIANFVCLWKCRITCNWVQKRRSTGMRWNLNRYHPTCDPILNRFYRVIYKAAINTIYIVSCVTFFCSRCSRGCDRVFYLLGSVPHAETDGDLHQEARLDPSLTDRLRRALLHLGDPLLRILRHQPNPLQHHVAQVPSSLPQHHLQTLQAQALQKRTPPGDI